MEHLPFIVLSCAAIGAWVHAMRRTETPFAWKVAAPVAIFGLVLYAGLASLRAAGLWFDERAEASLIVIGLMGMGFTVATGGFDAKKNTERRA